MNNASLFARPQRGPMGAELNPTDPLLVALAASNLARVLYLDGELVRSMEMSGVAVDNAERAGPIAETTALLNYASRCLLSGYLEQARSALVVLLPYPSKKGSQKSSSRGHSSPPPLRPIEATFRQPRPSLLPVSATQTRWVFSAGGLFYECRIEAQAAIDAYTADLSIAHGEGAAMSIDDLVGTSSERWRVPTHPPGASEDQPNGHSTAARYVDPRTVDPDPPASQLVLWSTSSLPSRIRPWLSSTVGALEVAIIQIRRERTGRLGPARCLAQRAPFVTISLRKGSGEMGW